MGNVQDFAENWVPVAGIYLCYLCFACVICVSPVRPVRKWTFPAKNWDFGRDFVEIGRNIGEFYRGNSVCVFVGIYLRGACSTCVLPAIPVEPVLPVRKRAFPVGKADLGRICVEFSWGACALFCGNLVCVLVGFYLCGACSTCVLPVLRLRNQCGLRRNPFSRKSCAASIAAKKSSCVENKSTYGEIMRKLIMRIRVNIKGTLPRIVILRTTIFCGIK